MFVRPRGDILARIEAGACGKRLLILCHGVTDSAASLDELIRRFSTTHRVVAFDSLGHGHSPSFTGETLADPIEAARLALEQSIAPLVAKYGRAIAVGHSMGAALLSRAAADHPEWFTGLILEDPAWLTTEQAARYRANGPAEAKRIGDMVGRERETIDTINVDYPLWPRTELAGWLQAKLNVDLDFVATGAVGYTEPWQTWLGELTVPTLVLSSDGDDTLLNRDGLRLIDSLANPALTTMFVPGLRHTMRRDNPAAFHQAVDPVIARWTEEHP